jgi:tRNA pseudouridine55 synthase
MPNEILAIYKPIGITSHQVAIRLSEKLGTVVTHTGSLDPMAEGVLVLLIGPEAKKRQSELQAVDKDYEFDLLSGFSTDSYDPLGLVTGVAAYEPENFPEEKLKELIARWVGKREQELPPFSSTVIRGKPLFWWAREGRLREVGLPVREIEIYKAELVRRGEITKGDLEKLIEKNVGLIDGDFRQDRIKEIWETALANHPNDRFSVATIRITVSSGTYVRSIANELGKALGIPSIALRILRTRNGRFDLASCKPLSELLLDPVLDRIGHARR